MNHLLNRRRCETAQARLGELQETTEKAVKDHVAFKEACNQFSKWIRQMQDKIPSLSAGPLSDRLSLETSITKFTNLKTYKPEGAEKLEKVKKLAAIAMETSNAEGQKLIGNNVDALEKEYNHVFGGIDKQIADLQELQIEIRKFKEDYESVNAWLQGMEKEIKQERTGTTLICFAHGLRCVLQFIAARRSRRNKRTWPSATSC